jgi:hypothetical protein
VGTCRGTRIENKCGRKEKRRKIKINGKSKLKR